MIKTYEIKGFEDAFEPCHYFGYSSYYKMVTKVTKTSSKEEMALANKKGEVGHLYKIDPDLQKGIHTLMKVTDLETDENAQLASNIHRKSDPRLRHYYFEMEEIGGALVFRYFVFYARVTKGDDNLCFKEFIRFCFKDNECWTEKPDRSVGKANPGCMFNPNASRINAIASIERRVTKDMKATLKKCYPSISAFWEIPDQSWISMKIFYLKYMELRKDTFLDKSIPDDIFVSLEDLDGISEKLIKETAWFNKKDMMPANPTPFSDKILWVIEECKSFVRIFKLCAKCVRPEQYMDLKITDVTYISKGKVYQFEKNIFDNAWSSSYRSCSSLAQGYHPTLLFHYCSNVAILDNDILTACFEDPEVIGKVQSAIRREFTYGQYIKFDGSGNPLVQGMASEKSLAAEQALKMGFFNLFKNPDNAKVNARAYGIALFRRFNKCNFSDVLGHAGKKLLKLVPRDIDIYNFHVLSDIMTMPPEEIEKKYYYEKRKKPICRYDLREVFKGNEDILAKLLARNDVSSGRVMISITYVVNSFLDEGKDPINFFRCLLRYQNRKAVAAQIDELPFDLQIPGRFRDYKAASLLSYYADYIEMLPDARKYINEHQLGENLKTILKPSEIVWMHDHAAEYQRRYIRECEVKSDEKAREDFKKVVAEPSYQDLADKTDTDFEIQIPAQAEDLINEGEMLHHCVAGYWRLVAAKNTRIVFVRKKSEPETPFFTGEVDHGKLVQLFGSYNQKNRDPRFTDFIRNWARERDIAIKCAI